MEFLRQFGNTSAKVIYITNIMTKYGETNSFQASDFLNAIEQYLGEGAIDYSGY